VLFAATSVIWGSSFLFIRVAVEHLPPSAVVFGRTALGTAFLVPLAIRNHAFRGLCRAVVPVLVVTALDMALPTFLTAWGEERVSSSVAGILTATDPLFTAVLALWLIRSEAVDRKRFTGHAWRPEVSAVTSPYQDGRTIASALGELGKDCHFGDLATRGRAEQAVLDMLASA